MRLVLTPAQGVLALVTHAFREVLGAHLYTSAPTLEQLRSVCRLYRERCLFSALLCRGGFGPHQQLVAAPLSSQRLFDHVVWLQ